MNTPVAARTSHRTIVYCVVPADLAKLYHPLRSWFAHWPRVEVVLDRRAAGGTTPTRVPRLPRIAAAAASRLSWVERPVARDEELARGDDREAARRLAAGDDGVLDELWLRHFKDVHPRIARSVSRRSRQHALTTAAFADAAHLVRTRPDVEVGQALRLAVDGVLADRRGVRLA